MKPRIGISTSFESGEQRLHPSYAAAVERSGGVPILLPVVQDRATVLAAIELVDGLVIPGGPAVVEGLIGLLPDDIDRADSARMRNDRWILEAALDRKLPLLGICYGMQLVNAYFGGTIYADVDMQCSLAGSHHEKRGGQDHELLLVEGTWLHRILQGKNLPVNTRHIQAIADVAAPFRIGARAPDDVVEAIESSDGRIMGVQFHAERMGEPMRPLFDHLITMASER